MSHLRRGALLLAGVGLLSCQGNPLGTLRASQTSTGTVSAAHSAKTSAYGRNAAEFLVRYHAEAIRNKATFTGLKFSLMADSTIGFFRGSAPLFYRDIIEHAALKSNVVIPLMGDLHLGNASAFKLASGSVTFELDDFDEAIEGPYTYDLIRLLVNIRLVAQDVNLSKATTDRLIQRFVSVYLSSLQTLREAPNSLRLPVIASWIPGPAAEAIQRVAASNATAKRARWTKAGRLITRKKVQPVDQQTRKALEVGLRSYASNRKETGRFFELKDVARRKAGLASLSKQRYLVLVEGPGPSAADDLILEFKQQGPAAAVPFLPSVPGNQAERVRRAWDYFVPRSDALLGTASITGADFLVRSLPVQSSGVDLEALSSETRFTQYIDTFALLTARAHARSGRSDEILKEAGTANDLLRRFSNFSAAYARQVELDREIWKAHTSP